MGGLDVGMSTSKLVAAPPLAVLKLATVHSVVHNYCLRATHRVGRLNAWLAQCSQPTQRPRGRLRLLAWRVIAFVPRPACKRGSLKVSAASSDESMEGGEEGGGASLVGIITYQKLNK